MSKLTKMKGRPLYSYTHSIEGFEEKCFILKVGQKLNLDIQNGINRAQLYKEAIGTHFTYVDNVPHLHKGLKDMRRYTVEVVRVGNEWEVKTIRVVNVNGFSGLRMGTASSHYCPKQVYFEERFVGDLTNNPLNMEIWADHNKVGEVAL